MIKIKKSLLIFNSFLFLCSVLLSALGSYLWIITYSLFLISGYYTDEEKNKLKSFLKEKSYSHISCISMFLTITFFVKHQFIWSMMSFIMILAAFVAKTIFVNSNQKEN
jgi:hypothetical protein